VSKAPHADSLDKKALATAVANLVEALKAEFFGEALKIKPRHRLDEVNTDGWCVEMAKIGFGLPSLQVWLDRLNGSGERHFWLGFAASKLPLISKAIASYSGPASSRKILDADVVKAKGNYKLREPLKELEARNPIPESYPKEKQFYFGIYNVAKKGVDGLNIPRALKFLVPIIRNLVEADLNQVEPGQRQFIKRLIRDRQAKFRSDILQAYNGACAVTCCEIQECLEAAHLDRYADTYDDHVTNGILLRADLHRLMDARLMTFLWSEEVLRVRINPSVKEKVYRDLNNASVMLPDNRSCWPSDKSIERHTSKAR